MPAVSGGIRTFQESPFFMPTAPSWLNITSWIYRRKSSKPCRPKGERCSVACGAIGSESLPRMSSIIEKIRRCDVSGTGLTSAEDQIRKNIQKESHFAGCGGKKHDTDKLLVQASQVGGSDTVVSLQHFYCFEIPASVSLWAHIRFRSTIPHSMSSLFTEYATRSRSLSGRQQGY